MASSEGQTILGYRVGEMLGFGAFSFARKGYHEETNDVVAMKFTKYTEGDQKHIRQQVEEVQKELTILKGIKHPNILNLLDFSQEEDYLTSSGESIKTYCMVLELCDGGELFDILYYTGQFSEKLARTFFRQIMSAVKACHDASVSHRDIKAQNVLLGENFQVKLADFGSSKIWTEGELMRTTRIGTKGYQAPEILLKRGYTKKADIFSCGVLLFIMLTRKPPFMEADPKNDGFFRAIAKGKYDQFWVNKHHNPDVSDECKELINGMLTYQPLQRWEMSQVMNSAWYNGEVLDSSVLPGHMAKLCDKAHKSRAKDKTRNYALYNSLKGVQTRGDQTPPPKIPFALKYISYKVPDHPWIYINLLSNHVTSILSGDAEMKENECIANLRVRLEEEILVKKQLGEGQTVEEMKIIETPIGVQATGYMDDEGQYYIYLKRVYGPDELCANAVKVDSYVEVFDSLVSVIHPVVMGDLDIDVEEN